MVIKGVTQGFFWTDSPKDRSDVALAKMVDNTRSAAQGACFVKAEENDVGNGYGHMLARMRALCRGLRMLKTASFTSCSFSSSSYAGQQQQRTPFNVPHVNLYVQYHGRVTRFRELLLLCAHVTSDQARLKVFVLLHCPLGIIAGLTEGLGVSG